MTVRVTVTELRCTQLSSCLGGPTDFLCFQIECTVTVTMRTPVSSAPYER